MFGRKKLEIIDEGSVCWNQEPYYYKKWADAWKAWAKVRNNDPSPKVVEKLWGDFVKADKDLKDYVERVYG